MRWPWQRRRRPVTDSPLPPDLDPQMPPDGSPTAMRCGICQTPRTYRALILRDGSARSLIFCPTCDAIPRRDV